MKIIRLNYDCRAATRLVAAVFCAAVLYAGHAVMAGATAEFTDVTTPVLAYSGYSSSVAWGDFDGDGDPDLAIAGSVWGGQGNRLIRNDGGGRFTDVTPPAVAATFSQGAAWADYDNDGNLDVFFADYGREHEGARSSLFRNLGNGDFTNVASGRLLEPLLMGAWADFDNDGYVDLYLAKGANNSALSRLMRNEQGNGFIDETKAPLDGHLWACAWADYDNDGDLDLLVLNNPLAATTNRLFRNDGGGAFTDVAAGLIGSTLGVAVGWGDYDNDGDLDVLIANGWGVPTSSRLLRNDNGTFVDATTAALSNLGAVGALAWGDYDNDGRLDLFLAKIHQSNQLFRNRGEGVFEDVTSAKLALSAISGSAAWADYDGDGDLDILVAGWLGDLVHLYRNDLADSNHWLQIDLQGGPSNRSAIGARVTLVAGGRTQTREVSGGTGCTSQDALTVHFGLGTNTVIDSVLIRWPSGTLQTLTGIGVDQHLRIVEAGPTNQSPLITSQPVGRSVLAGDEVRLGVVAWGTWPLAYQWRKGNEVLPKATNATLVLPSVKLADAGDYTVVISSEFGSVTSAAARLAVTERPWPYFADFEGVVGPEWSNRQTDVTPVGNRRFLGQFGNDTVSLGLGALPAHQTLTVSFDLFVIRTWDGSQPDGPDIWDCSVAGGPTFLHASFLNYPFASFSAQSFPENYPGRAYAAKTGAIETNTLGYVWADLADLGTMDAVYHLVFAFPHSAAAVTLNFAGQGLEYLDNESWGLDNVRIELTPAAGVPYVRTELSPVGSVAPPSLGRADQLVTSGTRALVTSGEAAVALVDLEDPAKPVVLGRWEPLFPPAAIDLAGNLAYIASTESDLLSTVEIVDFTDPAKPVLRGYYDTQGYAQDLAVVGNTLYVADDAAGLAIVDVSDPARPRRVGGYDTQGRMTRVEVGSQRAYVADGDWLLVLDVSDPTWPLRVGLYDLGTAVQEVRVAGRTAYVLAGGELRLLHVADPSGIKLLGTYRTFGVESFTVAGRYVYLAKGSRGLEVVDVSDPAKPVWVTGEWESPANDVALMGNYALVAGSNKGLVVYQLQQSLYPPLKPPVISSGMMTLTWATMNDVRLQKATNLINAVWLDVPESEGTNTLTLPMTDEKAFFRLMKGPKQGRLLQGMVAWWPGDGNTKDIVGGHDAILKGNATFAEGYVGQAFKLDDNGDFVEVADAPALNPGTSDFTATLWVKFGSLLDTQVLVEKLVHGAGGWTLCGRGDGALRFGWFWGGDHRFVDTPPLSTEVGTWLQFAVRRHGSEAVVYYGGLPAAAGPIAPDVNLDAASTLKFGHRGNPNDTPGSDSWQEFYLDGLVDEVMLFNRALTDAEIKAIYDAGSTGLAKPFP